jgi:hypothetical protein
MNLEEIMIPIGGVRSLEGKLRHRHRHHPCGGKSAFIRRDGGQVEREVGRPHMSLLWPLSECSPKTSLGTLD